MMVQLTTIWFSGSRGPLLGLMAGLVRLRHYVHGAAPPAPDVLRGHWSWPLAGALFLGVFNLPNTPLEPLKQIPYLGRLGSFLELEYGTGKVRVLIWEGAIQLIKADPMRTLIGWGPESMYVAYNRFYPPDLAHYEARNASPDRSHNETYDSLVITGVLGFLAYWTVFYTFFYFALNLLGLVRRQPPALALRRHSWPRASWPSCLLYAPGSAPALVAADPTAGRRCPRHLPRLLRAKLLQAAPPPGRRLGVYQGLLLAIFAAVLAHFIEIQFGIAIASTRTYFWLYLAMTVRHLPNS